MTNRGWHGGHALLSLPSTDDWLPTHSAVGLEASGTAWVTALGWHTPAGQGEPGHCLPRGWEASGTQGGGGGWHRPISLLSLSCLGSDCNTLFLALVPLPGALSQQPQPPYFWKVGLLLTGRAMAGTAQAQTLSSSGGPGWRPGAGRLPPASRAWPL